MLSGRMTLPVVFCQNQVFFRMRILLANDDGIHAPGLAALRQALKSLGDVFVVAPSKEQSGVSHSITFLSPLMVHQVGPQEWMIDGSPADCVKWGCHYASKQTGQYPDIVVSGINGGLNVGINTLYSGTVGAASEGAFYGIPSFAVSMQYCKEGPFVQAAQLACDLIRKILGHNPALGQRGKLYSINIPLSALEQSPPQVKFGRMDTNQYWIDYTERIDPLGRSYYWISGSSAGHSDPPPPSTPPSCERGMTDMSAVEQHFISVVPLQIDMTDHEHLREMQSWDWN